VKAKYYLLKRRVNNNLKKLTKPWKWNGSYLIRSGEESKAHYWSGEDTCCKMWSTGGLGKGKKYNVYNNTLGKKICHMCSVNWLKYNENAKSSIQV